MKKRDSTYFSMLYKLTIMGGVVFWATTFITSLLPIAAKYRAAFSNWSVQTVWVASLLIGLIIGCCVSYFLLRSMGKNPSQNPVLKSVRLSTIALVFAIVLIDVPQSFHGQVDVLYYFFIGVLFNTVRFLLLGFSIGYLYKRWHRPA
jgi:hypothetical protein